MDPKKFAKEALVISPPSSSTPKTLFLCLQDHKEKKLLPKLAEQTLSIQPTVITKSWINKWQTQGKNTLAANKLMPNSSSFSNKLVISELRIFDFNHGSQKETDGYRKGKRGQSQSKGLFSLSVRETENASSFGPLQKLSQDPQELGKVHQANQILLAHSESCGVPESRMLLETYKWLQLHKAELWRRNKSRLLSSWPRSERYLLSSITKKNTLLTHNMTQLNLSWFRNDSQHRPTD